MEQSHFLTMSVKTLKNFFGGTRVWTQGLALIRNALYHLSHSASPFCFVYFWGSLALCASWTAHWFYLCFPHSSWGWQECADPPSH
jgi:hypothetical protein